MFKTDLKQFIFFIFAFCVICKKQKYLVENKIIKKTFFSVSNNLTFFHCILTKELTKDDKPNENSFVKTQLYFGISSFRLRIILFFVY